MKKSDKLQNKASFIEKIKEKLSSDSKSESAVVASGKSRLSLRQKDALVGRAFVLPFYLGFLMFSLGPLIQTFRMMFYRSTVKFGGFNMEYIGVENFDYVFNKDASFIENLFGSVGNMVWQVPIILFISLFMAVLINTKFVGRSFVRVVFFLPVIVMTGTVMLIVQGDAAASATLSGDVVAGGKIEYSVGIETLLLQAGLDSKIVEFFTDISNDIFNLAWKAGVQIIIFLSGLQSIPSSLYEASSVEGATKWEEFFKITLPMLLPTFVLNAVYTIVDAFTDVNNEAMNQVMVQVKALDYGKASVMSYSYFVLIAVFVALVMWLFSALNKRYA
ncbi:MAG: sugar ABC transporter permease [Clostridia bacterium]|nr:sugar ABC transporter permease [Clostridia bacterium]